MQVSVSVTIEKPVNLTCLIDQLFISMVIIYRHALYLGQGLTGYQYLIVTQ